MALNPLLKSLLQEAQRTVTPPTLTTLGAAIGVSTPTLSRWESGQGTQQIEQFVNLLALLPAETIHKLLHRHIYMPELSIFSDGPELLADSYLVLQTLSIYRKYGHTLAESLDYLDLAFLHSTSATAIEAWKNALKQNKYEPPTNHFTERFIALFNAGSHAGNVHQVFTFAANQIATVVQGFPNKQDANFTFELQLLCLMMHSKCDIRYNLEQISKSTAPSRAFFWVNALASVTNGYTLNDSFESYPFNPQEKHWLKLLLPSEGNMELLQECDSTYKRLAAL